MRVEDELIRNLRLPQVYLVLKALAEADKELSIGELIEKAGVPETTYYVNLRRGLLALGLIEEESGPGRIKYVKITEKGRKLYEALAEILS